MLLKQIAKLGLCFIPCFAYGTLDIETAKSSILTLLAQNNPSVMGEFKQLCNRYDRIVGRFFDAKNTDPLKTHINYMEAELRTFKDLCSDPRFACAHTILTTYYNEIKSMIALLKKYIGSRNTISMALNVRNYKYLLPKVVKDKGDLYLLKGLNHRLRC